MSHSQTISVVVPVFNEAAALPAFHASLVECLKNIPYKYEVIYCDDGSSDDTSRLIQSWHSSNANIKLVSFSRNFGKEYALTAGIAQAHGAAIITIDGDGQHPVELIPQFIKQWEDGSQVVIGIRGNHVAPLFNRLASKLFYTLFNHFTSQRLEPNSTDFRLIDRVVQQAFLELPETNRITRGLIDWLGFQRTFITFNAKERAGGTATYSRRSLWRLATDSFVSLSPKPLYFFGVIGVIITSAAFVLGSTVFVEQILLNDPWNWNFTGSAMLAIIIVFLVGIVLMSQGILSLYVSNIQAQTKRRPLYVIDPSRSAGLGRDKD